MASIYKETDNQGLLQVVWIAAGDIHKQVNSLSELFCSSGGGEETPDADDAGGGGQRAWGLGSFQAAVWPGEGR